MKRFYSRWFVSEMHEPTHPIKRFFTFADASAYCDLLNEHAGECEKYILAYDASMYHE